MNDKRGWYPTIIPYSVCHMHTICEKITVFYSLNSNSTTIWIVFFSGFLIAMPRAIKKDDNDSWDIDKTCHLFLPFLWKKQDDTF